MKVALKLFLISLCLVLSTIRVAGASITVKNGLLRAQSYSYSLSKTELTTQQIHCVISGDCKFSSQPAFPLLNPRILALDTLDVEVSSANVALLEYQIEYPQYVASKHSPPFEAIDKPPQSFF